MSEQPSPPFDDLSIIQESAPSTNVPSDKKAELETKKYEGSVKRQEGMKNAIHQVFIVFVYIAFGIFVIVFMARVLHMIFPENWQWLSAEQVQEIDKLIFSGAIGGFIGRYFKRFNEPE